MSSSFSLNLIQFSEQIQKETRCIEKASLKKPSSSIFFRCFSSEASPDAIESLVIQKIETVALCIFESVPVEGENSSELIDYVSILTSFKSQCVAVIGLERFSHMESGAKIMEEISRLGMFRESKHGYLLDRLKND